MAFSVSVPSEAGKREWLPAVLRAPSPAHFRKKRVVADTATIQKADATPLRGFVMPFRFTGLSPEQFAPLFALTDSELIARGMRRVVADSKPGYPCRVSLEDAEPGERLILLPFDHQPAHSPYKASGPIFVREHVEEPYDGSAIPDVLHGRLLSLRGYDAKDLIVEADVVEGAEAETALARMFADAAVSYVHIHNAKRGCYSCRVDRV